MESDVTIVVWHRPHLRRSILEPSMRSRGAAASDVVVLGCKVGDGHFQAPASGTGCAEATAARHGSSPRQCPYLARRLGFGRGGCASVLPPLQTAAELSAFS